MEAGQLPNSMVINSFSVEAKDDKYIAKYSISDCPEQVQIEVFADTDNEGLTEKRYTQELVGQVVKPNYHLAILSLVNIIFIYVCLKMVYLKGHIQTQ